LTQQEIPNQVTNVQVEEMLQPFTGWDGWSVDDLSEGPLLDVALRRRKYSLHILSCSGLSWKPTVLLSFKRISFT
jgi:hypothetical protein